MTLANSQSFTFTVTLQSDGQMNLDGVPDDEHLALALAQTIGQLHPPGQTWAARYRAYQPTVPDLPAEVPRWRRLRGEVSGLELRLTGGEISHDGETWVGFPLDAPRYLVTHWQEGRIDIEPDPPEDDLETLEDAARAWHGESPQAWEAAHRQLQPQGEVPAARRTVFELRPDGYQPLPEQAAYSPDGEAWSGYDPDAGDDTADLGAFGALEELFGGMLDLDTVAVTVYANGRVEWPEGSVPAEEADRIIADLRQATGAGDSVAWAAWTAELLTETYDEGLEVPAGLALPVPQAVRLEIPTDALTDPDPLEQTFMESEVTFDGSTWHDLFAEELPEELEPFANQGEEENHG